MKLQAVGFRQYELIPQNDTESEFLAAAYREGHLHFVCKAYYLPSPRAHRRRLLITPSLINWQRPRGRK